MLFFLQSGYGLETETELKMLQVLEKARLEIIIIYRKETVSWDLWPTTVPLEEPYDILMY